MADKKDLSDKRILIVEENSMLSSSIKNMLKKMGGAEDKLHKAQNVMTFKQLVNQHRFDLIICSYASKKKIVGPKYHYLYQQSRAYSRDCSFVVIANSGDDDQIRGAEELEPDNILGHPFNYNQFKQLIASSLIKRSILATVHKKLEIGLYDDAIEICNRQSKRKGIEWLDFHKVVVDCYVKQNKYDSALLVLKQLSKQVKHRWPLVKQISLHNELGNEVEALTLAHEYELLGYPDDPLVSQITARHSLLDCDLDKAVRVMIKLSIRYPHIVHLTLKCVMLCIMLSDYRKASMFLAKIDYDSVLDDEELVFIEELRLFLEALIAIKTRNKMNPATLKTSLKGILAIQENELTDSHKFSKGLYQLLLQVNGVNPVCSPKRLELLYNQTTLEHRKFALLAVALHIGCLDLARTWLDELRLLNSSKKDIAMTISCIVLEKAEAILSVKAQAIQQATEKASLGRVIDALAIKAKEAPYFINHHSHFINAMLKFKVSDSSNIELLKEQFPVSVGIVIENLIKQDPMHPKVTQIQKAKRIVQKRLQTPLHA
ncbi:response regulator [Vibrio europaeus]|uniref:response regulator n=1 Tax=Vibrio europaeus TaxID=300876 RepID=UPI0023407776|nr:response regulator [Vibrio europaeus]MDC5840849.1 response regulator [Vibrio europaeus]